MPETDETKRLSCLEVWGGNRFVSTSVALPGMDAWIYSMPADGQQSIGGGDVHYVSSCAAGALTRLLIADVAGHGQSASATAHRLRKMMRFHVNFHTQTRFVRALNTEFTALQRSERFATAVAFTYDAPLNRLLVCNAGHPPPLIWRKRDAKWSSLHNSVGNLPLGIEDIDFEQYESPIETGDVVLCFTDGLLESRRGDHLLGEEGLFDFLRWLDPNDPALLAKSLPASLAMSGWTIEDDLTLLIFRPNGTRNHIPIHDRLLAPFRAMKWLGQVALGR
jgi:serine phosphatase RsbU (regulator of sigma subunit)